MLWINDLVFEVEWRSCYDVNIIIVILQTADFAVFDIIILPLSQFIKGQPSMYFSAFLLFYLLSSQYLPIPYFNTT